MGTDHKKIHKKLATWQGKLLSLGGRLTLIKSALSRLPLYYISLYPGSKFVIDQMNKIQRKFFWSGSLDKKSMCLVPWARIELSKIIGGLGVGCPFSRNIALLFTWIWRYFYEPQALWRKGEIWVLLQSHNQ